LEIKTEVAHFQGKTVTPEWEITDILLILDTVDIRKLMHLGSHKQDFGEGAN
jgi:hypothetical protein